MRPGIVDGDVQVSYWPIFLLGPVPFMRIPCKLKRGFYLRFLLAHKHKDVRTRRMVNLTQFSIPALLNPMINKMADEASAILLLICSHEVWVKVTYDWSTALCLCLCLCRPSFH